MAKKKQKTVRMLIGEGEISNEMRWFWWVYYGKVWLRGRPCTSEPGCRRSGNAWAKRMDLTPKWE